MGTMSPDNCSLYFGGHIEVPNAYGPCGPGCDTGAACDNYGGGVPANAYPMLPGREGIDPVRVPADENFEPVPAGNPLHGELEMPTEEARNAPVHQPVRMASRPTATSGGYMAPRPANYRRETTPKAPPAVPAPARSNYSIEGGLIGPVGYDVE
jgi:hypothetical protein